MTRPASEATAHARSVALLERWAPPSTAQALLRRRLVEHLRARPDGLLRTCRPDHLTASVVVLTPDAGHALLTLHAKAGRWFQLGGHVEPDDADLVAAAQREGTEESGLTSLRLDTEPVHLDVHPVPFCGPGTHHLDVRFVAVAPEQPVVASAESTRLRWWSCDALPGSDLVEVVGLARARVLSR